MSIANKLGPHHMLDGPESGRWLALTPAVAKFVGDLGAGIEARPGTLTIGRVVDDGWLGGQSFDMNRYVANGDDSARLAGLYVDWLADKIRLNPWIQVWEGPNEQVFIHDSEREAASSVFKAAADVARKITMRWYAEFCYQFAARLDRLGKRAGLGSWSTGNPLRELDLLRHYGRALQACTEFGAYACRHDYGGVEPDGTLRIDHDQAEFARLGFPNVQQIITECGMDAVQWIPGAGAWKVFYNKDFGRYWNECLKPFLDAISRRPYCKGACLFTDGGGGGAGGWGDFDVAGTNIVERLAAYAPPAEGDTDMADEAKQAQARALLGDAKGKIEQALALLAPAPVPLYQARTLIDLALRDAAGNPAHDSTLAPTGAPAGLVKAGTVVSVWKEAQSAGAFNNRAWVTPEGLNIWALPSTLQRL